MSFVAELKRRNVIKVSGAYLALGWFVLESSGTLVSALNLPGWTISFLFWLGLAGLPFVVVSAWVFELTPDGLKRSSEVDPAQSATAATSKRLDYVIIGLLVLAIGLFLLQYFRPPVAPVVTTDGATVSPIAPTAEVAAPVPSVPALEPVAVPPDDKSIAVLPFADMSQAKDQEYFSDGMSEELLNLLAKIPELKVIARTSSFAFKGKDVSIAEIAKQLGVAHVLEGSVRKSGNNVRITAQLIRTADSVHLWSETYDRPLDDIFKVQDEIANAIVQALQIKLAGGELSRRKGGTQNLEAYQLYLRGLSANVLGTKRSVEAASVYLEQAIQIEPNYGQALAILAGVMTTKAELGLVDPIEGYEQARRLLVHALELSPENAAAHARLQYIYWAYDWDWAAAEEAGKKARELDPHDSETLFAASMLSVGLGRWNAAEESLKESLVRDPQNAWTIWNLGNIYYLAGRFADSEAIYRKLLALQPDFVWTHLSLGKTLLAEGKAVEALSLAEQVIDEGERLQYLPVFLDAVGREAEANVAQQAQIARWEGRGAYFIAMTYAYRGDADRAIEWLDRAYKQKDLWLCLLLGEPLFKPIAKDPRFIAFLKKMNLPTEPVPVNWQQ